MSVCKGCNGTGKVPGVFTEWYECGRCTPSTEAPAELEIAVGDVFDYSNDCLAALCKISLKDMLMCWIPPHYEFEEAP
jgi:hypothetical protein